jgi:hypothetical protein
MLKFSKPSAYAFMRLCVYGWGLFSVTSFRLVPPPGGGAARFPFLETVKTVTSPAMPTLPRQCEYSAGGGQGAPATTLWPFLLERAFLKSLSHKRQEGPGGDFGPPVERCPIICQVFLA